VDIEVGGPDGELTTRRMKVGDTLHITPGTRHRVTAVEDSDICERRRSCGGRKRPWRQVFDLYRQRIESGELPPGARLPSIRGISQEFGIAGTTAQQALPALKADGLVVTSPMGTFDGHR